ncbi:efflux RND transporter periplasmic adaptor subunit [Helicobacter muridarum]|uniref:Efflux RND transporter periplasmic adaptor subunit n=1 Tax=Helicobacter muridarum TaxID=216 RepID=A0A099TWU3_9HELI|nr:efflux RND transporter periplasmic adaptor subunit [Helicobacter muridarum]TLE00620.1 efflux RND transporter periplasmic adaptor subunit [Helicobacter muridarum]STQ85637.1 RND family efflux transporter MFP subunit [Helicobacter muridarum]
MPTSEDIYKTITPTKKKYILFVWLAILAFLILLVMLFVLRDGNEVIYTTVNPIKKDITQTVSATGTLSPTNEVEIGSQISGTIYKLYVDVNDVVKKDQILAEINPNKLNQTKDGYEAQLTSALANLEASKVSLSQKEWNYRQQQKLYEATNGRSPSLLELQTAKMEYLSAKADIKVKRAAINQIQTNLRTSNIDLQNSIIRSPIDGIVLERSVSLGQTVAANFQSPTLFKLAENLGEMNLVVNISESDIGRVRTGQEAIFNVDAYPNQEFRASVDRVNFAATTTDNITSYETTIHVNNDNLLLKPGMNATAQIKVASSSGAMIVPLSALFYDPEQSKSKVTQKKASSNPLTQAGGPSRPRSERAVNTNTKTQPKGQVWILEEGNVIRMVEVGIGISDSKMVEIISSEIDTNTKIVTESKYK